MNPGDFVSVPLAAKRTSKSETTIRREVMSGAIQGVKMGRDWFIQLSEVERLAVEYPLQPAAVSSGK